MAEPCTLAFFLEEKQNICNSWLLASSLLMSSSLSHVDPNFFQDFYSGMPSPIDYSDYKAELHWGHFNFSQWSSVSPGKCESGNEPHLSTSPILLIQTLLFKTLKQTYRKIRSDPVYMLKLPDTCVCLEEISPCLY